MRYDPASKRVDSLAKIKGADLARTESGGENSREVRISPVPMLSGDGWAVGRNGVVALGRVGPYRVDWIDAAGKVTQGAPVPHTRVRVGAAEKAEWATDQQLRGGVGMQVNANNDEVTVTFARNRGNRPPSTAGLKFPDYKPAFDNATMIVDPRGRAWVQRNLDAGNAPQYDVLDAAGRLAATITMPARARVVGFGAKGVYVTTTDDDGLQTIHRYALPL